MARTTGTTNLEVNYRAFGGALDAFARSRGVMYMEAREQLFSKEAAVAYACGCSAKPAREYRRLAEQGQEPFAAVFGEMAEREMEFRRKTVGDVRQAMVENKPDKLLAMAFPDLDKPAQYRKASRDYAVRVATDVLIRAAERFELAVADQEWGPEAARLMNAIVDASATAMADAPGGA